MKTFLQRFGSLILGVLTGLDRLILRGELCALYSPLLALRGHALNFFVDRRVHQPVRRWS